MNHKIAFIIEKKASDGVVPAQGQRFKHQLVHVAEGQVHTNDDGAVTVAQNSLKEVTKI